MEELFAVPVHHPPPLLLLQLLLENVVTLFAKCSVDRRLRPPHIPLPLLLIAQFLVDRNDGLARTHFFAAEKGSGFHGFLLRPFLSSPQLLHFLSSKVLVHQKIYFEAREWRLADLLQNCSSPVKSGEHFVELVVGEGPQFGLGEGKRPLCAQLCVGSDEKQVVLGSVEVEES